MVDPKASDPSIFGDYGGIGRGTGFLQCDVNFTLFFALECLQDTHIELFSRQSHFWIWGLLFLRLRKTTWNKERTEEIRNMCSHSPFPPWSIQVSLLYKQLICLKEPQNPNHNFQSRQFCIVHSVNPQLGNTHNNVEYFKKARSLLKHKIYISISQNWNRTCSPLGSGYRNMQTHPPACLIITLPSPRKLKKSMITAQG